MSTVETVACSPIGSYRATLGETPVWCERSQSLLWVDIPAQRLLRLWPEQDDLLEIRDLPWLTSAALLTEQAGVFLLVGQQGGFLYDYARQTCQQRFAYPADAVGTRPNEAAIAPDGSLWFGTMDPLARQAIGKWYRYTAGQTVPVCVWQDVLVPNTLAWQGDRLWMADSLRQRFSCMQYHNGQLRQIATHPVPGMTPDGSAVTADGLLINACWGSGTLRIYRPERSSLVWQQDLRLPVTQPSSCAFGGADFSQLYVTSATTGLTRPDELEGALLRVQSSLRGRPASRFKLSQ